jgi:hypothetical protein
LSEGRKRFFERFAQIESGQRCGRFRSTLSLVSDGEATPDDARLLKRHLRACPTCRATLRDYRALPARMAELLPPAVFLPAIDSGSWWSRLNDSLTLWIADRGGAIPHKVQQIGESLSAQKATAVVASTAALTGGAVVHERAGGDRQSHGHPHSSVSSGSSAASQATTALSKSLPPPATQRVTSGSAGKGTEPDPPSTGAGEFTPEQGSLSSGQRPTPGTQARTSTVPRPSATSSGAVDKSGDAGQEFGP